MDLITDLQKLQAKQIRRVLLRKYSYDLPELWSIINVTLTEKHKFVFRYLNVHLPLEEKHLVNKNMIIEYIY